ncbi:hypothetical protein FQN54_009131 [Arachnomyces sp. PD_36]|nr:hypothetical protein FQN54_009131 [Arachnomyces sp. PD_36]
MDMQGKPIGINPTGTKTKNDPARYNDPRQEGAGPVASDSLAADSTRSGGAFSQNRDAQPLGVSGSHSTFANEDTSSATRLDAAPDAEARKARDDWSDVPSSGLHQNQHPGSSTTSRTAPTYVHADSAAAGSSMKPKGKNLTEGGFDNSAEKNASFTSDIGSKQDPGRLAEKKLQHGMAELDADARSGERDRASKGNQQPYGALGSEEAA